MRVLFVMIRCLAAVSDWTRVRRFGAPLLYCFLAFPSRAALIQTFSEPTTVTVETRVQLFEERPSPFPEGEELSTASLILAESDGATSAPPVLPPVRRGGESADGSDSTTVSADLNASASRLPARADRSTTAAQAHQLLRFERRNQIAEAFLLARDLVARDPGDEFALDAAIRTSLVLGRAEDLEALYRQAIQRARLPGKYYVQLAHWYLRTGQNEKLKTLLTDFEKSAPRDGEFFLTLTRMRVIAEDEAGARKAVEQAAAQKNAPSIFPLVMLSARLSRLSNDPSRAADVLLNASGDDFGPWERRAQLIEFLKVPDLKPEGIVSMVEAALVNEPSYARARAIADRILDRALEERIFFPLRAILVEKIAADDASDIERWLVALMYQRKEDEAGALQVLQGGLPADAVTSSSDAHTTATEIPHEDDFLGGTTPVIAYERAMALARTGRHGEAVAIASNLLAEQPTEWPVRLLLAEQQMAAGDAEAALQTVSAWSGRQRLDSASRVRRAEVATSAVLALDDPAVLTDTWLDLARDASFAELQAMGRVITRAKLRQPATTSTVAPLRERVETVLRERNTRPEDRTLWLLRARLAARDEDRAAELGSYLRFLEQEPENTAMLRHVADLAARYANVPLELHSAGGNGPGGTTLRATDSTAADAALHLYRRLIELQPRVPSNYAALMRIYLMRGEAETARRVAAELVERETSSPESLDMAARILHDNGFAADALPYYRPLVMASPEDFELWARFAGALRSAGKPELAQPILRKILEEGLYGRAYAQEQLLASLVASARESNTLPQIADYLQSLRTGTLPDKPGFLLTAARLLAEAGLSDRAEPFLADFEQHYPDSPLLPNALLLSARIQAVTGSADAAETLAAVAERFTTSPQAVTALAEAAELKLRAGQAAEAVEALEQLAMNYPEDDRALAALVRAAQIAVKKMNDRPRAVLLLRRYLDSGSQDFALRRKVQNELRRLDT